ncbi:MAG: isoprenylcysteine carboxylmethyltransferase family protein [Vicinamibacterales bacterium]
MRQVTSDTTWARAGGWAFRQRSWLPVPLALILVVVRTGATEANTPIALGLVLVTGGLALRLWAVRHIGDISRTRANRSGALQTSGPYAVVRNPLYCANWLLWTGFTLASELIWMLPIAWLVFALQYGAIVRWEERFMRAQFGGAYDKYAASTSRWVPSWHALRAVSSAPRHRWGRVFFSERGTLIATACMLVLLAIKDAVS